MGCFFVKHPIASNGNGNGRKWEYRKNGNGNDSMGMGENGKDNTVVSTATT